MLQDEGIEFGHYDILGDNEVQWRCLSLVSLDGPAVWHWLWIWDLFMRDGARMRHVPLWSAST